MKMINHTPPITRVHNLFRLRTVLNAITKLSHEDKEVTDDEISDLLAKTGLSKYKPEKLKDRIGRRARDHLETLARMGLAWRIEKKRERYNYRSSPVGRRLAKYKFTEECPKEPLEEAIFIDRLMKMKLPNPYGPEVQDYRTRPCLTILFSLANGKPKGLHLYHIGFLLGETTSDPCINPELIQRKIRAFSKHGLDSSGIEKLEKEYKIDEQKKRSIRRDTRPLTDWCSQLGLVEVNDDWFRLTERGRKVLDEYIKKQPIWYDDLKGKTPQARAAVLLFYQFMRSKGICLPSFPDKEYEFGLVKMRMVTILSEIAEKIGRNIFESHFTNLSYEIDLSPWYDIPYSDREQVLSYLETLLNKELGVDLKDFIESTEMKQVKKLEEELQQENEELRREEQKLLWEKIGHVPPRKDISLPSILSRCDSSFEKESLILLRMIDFNAQKYSGNFVDYVGKRFKKLASNNPDHLLFDGFCSLVECKSEGEWGKKLRYSKKAQAEIEHYQKYTEETGAESTLFFYEGEIDVCSKNVFKPTLSEMEKMIIATRSFIVESIGNPTKKRKIKKIVAEPEKYGAEERLLN